jgi:hypothetical protein
MCEDIETRRGDHPVDFILVTGDLAFSGKAEEYHLVRGFLDDLSVASGVPKERIFCIPGNHDIDRDRQRFCFRGARAALQDSSNTDSFLGAPGEEDFRTLLLRQESYRLFQSSYFGDQERIPTDDGLGYVAQLTLNDVRLAILGLDTAWLANGGTDDHMKLLLGERQVMNALDLAKENDAPPHILISMGHHPLHLLQDFDRRVVQSRIEKDCHFYHCGHLHEPEERPAGQTPSGCLTVATGASFETRQSQNTYSFVRLDLLRAERVVTTHRYSPASGAFNSTATQTYRIEVKAFAACDIRELADGIAALAATSYPYYLAALILERKAEVPVPTGTGHALASLAAMDAVDDCDLKRETIAFLAFRNALKVMYGRLELGVILAKHGDAVVAYATALSDLCDADGSLRERLDRQEADARSLAEVEPVLPFTHTIDLWKELAADHEWDLLREKVEHHVASQDEALATQATRMLALALASSDEQDTKRRAIELYRTLVVLEPPEPSDFVNLARLLVDTHQADDAKSVVIMAIQRCPATATHRLYSVGQIIVEATGDREFRDQLTAAIEREVQIE